MGNEKIWTADEVREKLAASDKMLERSLAVLFAFQTEDERHTEETRHVNGAGFNSCDAGILSSFAKQCAPGNHRNQYPEGRRLSFKQKSIARKKLVKYSKQLAEFANREARPLVTVIEDDNDPEIQLANQEAMQI